MAHLTNLPAEIIRIVVEQCCGADLAAVLAGHPLSCLQQRVLSRLVKIGGTLGIAAREILWARVDAATFANLALSHPVPLQLGDIRHLTLRPGPTYAPFVTADELARALKHCAQLSYITWSEKPSFYDHDDADAQAWIDALGQSGTLGKITSLDVELELGMIRSGTRTAMMSQLVDQATSLRTFKLILPSSNPSQCPSSSRVRVRAGLDDTWATAAAALLSSSLKYPEERSFKISSSSSALSCAILLQETSTTRQSLSSDQRKVHSALDYSITGPTTVYQLDVSASSSKEWGNRVGAGEEYENKVLSSRSESGGSNGAEPGQLWEQEMHHR